MPNDSSTYKALCYWADRLPTVELYRHFDLINKVYLRTPWDQAVARERAVLLTEVNRREAVYLNWIEGR